jgi:two-component system, LytTR family, sensor kinase
MIFWLAYYCVSGYFEHLWLKDIAGSWPASKLLVRGAVASLLYLVPYMSISYYLLYFGIVGIIQQRRKKWLGIAQVIIVYLLGVLSVIIIARLIVLPYVYENVIPPQGHFILPSRFLGIMIEAAFPAGLLLCVQYVEALQKARAYEQQIEKEKLNAELKMLKSQLNPHFLFNTLNNIYALTRKKSDMASHAVLKLSEMLSFMLYEASNNTIPIRNEIQFLEDYISLQKLRYPDSLDLSFTKDIDDVGKHIAPLLLLPLVENAFKHGASESHSASFIYMHLKLQGSQLLFTIENNFEQVEHATRPTAIGIYNINRQLHLIYKEQQLTLSNENGIFKAQLILNLDSYEQI